MRSGFLAALAALFLATACSPGVPTAEPYSVTDSVGITIVENESPQWTNDGWTIAEDPEWVFGKDGMSQDGISLEHITAIRPMSNERTAVLDRGSKQVFVLGALGQLLDVFGGEGDGPGELQRPGSLHACGDTLLITNLPRIDQFVTGTGFVGQLHEDNLPATGTVRGASPDCRLLDFVDYFAKRPSLQVGDTRPLVSPIFWFDRAAGRLNLAYLDSTFGGRIGAFPGAETPIPRSAPWGASESRVVSDTFMIQGVGRRPELRWHVPSGGVVKVVRWAQDSALVTQEDIDGYEEKRRLYLRQWGGAPDANFAFPKLDWWPAVPSAKPYFDEVQVDDTDHVWVRENSGTLGLWDPTYPPTQIEPSQLWFVFDASGRWLGEVAMPANFTLHAVADGKVVGVMEDELDVQTVRAYRIEGH